MNTLFNLIKEYASDDEIKEEINKLSLCKLNSTFKGINVLSLVVQKGNLDLIEYLLDKGVDVNGVNCFTGLPLDIPIVYARDIDDFDRFKSVVLLLMARGANLNGVGLNNKTLIYHLLKQSRVLKENHVLFVMSKGAKGGTFEYIVYNYIEDESNYYLTRHCRLYGIETSRVTDRDELLDLLNSCKLGMSDVCTSKFKGKFYDYVSFLRKRRRERIAKRCGYKINEYTLMGDSVHYFCDDNLYLSIEGSFGWYFHMSDLPSILYSQKNPYTFEAYSVEKLKDMASCLSYIDYCLPEDVNEYMCTYYKCINRLLPGNYVSFLSEIVSYVDPYINISDILKIRPKLFKEFTVYFKLDFVKRGDDINFFFDNLCMHLLFMLRNGFVELYMIVQMFCQVLQDDLLYTRVLEILNLDLRDAKSILPLTESQIIKFYGVSVMDSILSILNRERISLDYLFSNILRYI